jgi:hypothetical protein
VNDPAAAASIGGAIRPTTIHGLQALRTGLELARASQLTMLRFQLALRRSNRHAAMQALDTLLDIDAEMEGLAASLDGAPAHPANDAALSGFIGRQKAAIAAEKHALTGGDWRSEAGQTALSAPDGCANDADLPEQSVFPDDESENYDRTRGRRWTCILAVAIVAAVIVCGVMIYLWPTLPAATVSEMRGLRFIQRL